MKVRVSLVLDIDVDAWENIYSPHQRPGQSLAEAVRVDVREYAIGQLRESAAAEEGAIRDAALAATR